MAEEWLSPRSVADEVGVTVRTVQRWIDGGRLPAERIGGRLRVSRSSLAAVRGEARAPVGAGAPTTRRIRSLLIANRGEIAARIARTARLHGIRTVGVHGAGEHEPRGVDEAHQVGSYLDVEDLVRVAANAGADAVHPGYGFLAESADFARAVGEAGLTWVGPPPEAIAAMGDKAAARRLVAGHGVPVLPGYDGEAQDDAVLRGEAERIGYPLLVKPSAGGGGKGMRVVREAAELEDALGASRREAQRAFGDDRLILERLVEHARHVEIQVLFDAHGAGLHLGERDCSTQRRNQKVVEESPAPAVDAALRERMGAAALRAAASVGYVNAGTVEFLLADDGSFTFLEMNTRLQVEHPVTEAVTGRDLVADQLRIAAGEPLGLAQADVRMRGHAIEARIYAEDPEAGYLPATGRIVTLEWPSGPRIRVDAGVVPGDAVTERYDPMLAKLIADGSDRAEALERLAGALEATTVLGLRTNVRFLRWLVGTAPMRAGEMRTDTLAHLALPATEPPTDGAWAVAARALAGGEGPWAGGWRPNGPAVVRLRSGELERAVAVPPADARAHRSVVDPERGLAFVDAGGQSVEFGLAPAPTVEEASRHAAAHAGSDAVDVTAPMPGRVIAVRAAEGAEVEAHQALVVIEAMKMEHAVAAPIAGTVSELSAREGEQVERGQLLARVTPYHGPDG
jgi:excisionase family DNA binding protein